MSGDSVGYILALDIGTTNLRCHVINSQAKSMGSSCRKVKLYYPQPGWVEIDPDELFSDILNIVHQAMNDANVAFTDIKSLGISTQRSTFITWKKNTGEHLHNFITWKDLRATDLLKDINNSWSTTMLKWGAYLIYLLTRNKKFGMGSKLKIANKHVSGRLLWVLTHLKNVQEALQSNNLMFGTVETWLIYKLTEGGTYVTDISNASATGFYDPFDLNWGIIAKLLKIPTHILPTVVSNDFDFGCVTEKLFGVPIKIGCTMADQSSSMFGSWSFNKNDVKITIGTGAFLDINTSDKIHPSLNNIYPLVGWKINNELTYMSEVSCNDAGCLVDWLQQSGIIENQYETSDMASKVEDSDGVYFIPAFSGSVPPFENENVAAGFIGIKPTTKREHLVRAVLESIVYQIIITLNILKKERKGDYDSMKIDGGMSNNDFVCQLLADLAAIPIYRMCSSDMSIMGVTYISGLSCGIWKNKDDLKDLLKLQKQFQPVKSQDLLKKYEKNFNHWILAVERFKSWNKYSEVLS
ncbi:unnamed protein product [Phaedon cochleariae]|uniref:Glycerol kinase 5 n=1 Tax=Phaedon cochleariae TaxID=80249 RepID=A0A9P0DL32_PHACE|nr:unnamed protein product [Phaedon cochleariae]